MIPVLVDTALRELRRANRQPFALSLRDLLRQRVPTRNDRTTHLHAAMAWLCRAQDATGGGGVARSYCVTWNPSFKTSGWLAAYPETTGYIIPTFFDHARRCADGDSRRRAIAMADWEIEVQLPSGAVRGGILGMPPSPAVFNTGQVLFGWLRAAAETGERRFLDAALRAGEFLLAHQDADGTWRRALSRYAAPGLRTYNTRTAWGLLHLAAASGDGRYQRAAIRNIEAALTRQLDNGWFRNNCVDDEERPLTHTIAYATRGILEAGDLLAEARYVVAARRSADALLHRQRPDGSLAGRYDSAWRPAARWSCLTGNAQVAVIWLRLARILGEEHYAQAARRAIDFLCSVQDLDATDPGVRGAIAGAYPIYGDYGRFEYLNWATKFFVDALLLEADLAAERAADAGAERAEPNAAADRDGARQ